jgi:uncharacterized membrane protein YcaP (DUF421 family)
MIKMAGALINASAIFINKKDDNVFSIFVRAFILYLVVVVIMRIMGKRQIGQLQPYELAVAVMVSELAAVPMQNAGIPIIHGIIPIITILILQLIFSFMSLKSVKMRALICGKPSILVQNGKIIEENLRKEIYTLNELLEQLRIKDIPNIADVEFAILETNGQLSVIPKSQKRPLNAQDINIPTNYEGLPLDLIVDGAVMHDNLTKAGLDEKWLLSQLNSFGVGSFHEVLFANLDTSGNLYFQEKHTRKERPQ